jgi:hypothetical protein
LPRVWYLGNNVVVSKPQPNHARYLQALQRLGPARRLAKAFELSAQAKALFLQGLRQRYPDLPPQQLHHLALRQLAKCHNRNY